MKRIIIISLALALTVQSCDFVRVIAGRPTAAQVEAIRQDLARQEEERHQARLDSMKKVQQHMADSIAAVEAFLLDSLSQTKGLRNPSNLGGLETTMNELDGQYYIVVGAFRDIDNARRKQFACYDAGYPAKIVSFRSGLNAVAICPSSSLGEVMKQLNTVKGTSVCPKDAWILSNK